MNLNSLISLIFFYGIFLMTGGAIGYFRGGSAVSFYMGGFAGMIAIFAALFMNKKPKGTSIVIISLSSLMTLLFLYRLILTHKLMPAGLMLGVSIFVLIIMFLKKADWSQAQKD